MSGKFQTIRCVNCDSDMDYSSLGKTWKHCEGGDTSAECPMVLIESTSYLPLGACLKAVQNILGSFSAGSICRSKSG